jgi:hypothetical protein
MKSLMIACFAAAALVAAGPAGAADEHPGLPMGPEGETVGAAAGKAKPLFARANMTCEASACFANFGRKGGKTRTIAWMTCGAVTYGGILRAGAVVLEDPGNPIGYMDVTSRAVEGTDELAIFTFTKPFEVPPGERLLVYAATTGMGGGGQCTLSGTVE